MKHKVQLFCIVLSTTFFFHSCDLFNDIDGLVVDDMTKSPVDSAHIYIKDRNKNIESKSIVRDSLTLEKRLNYIRNYGNKENWHYDSNFKLMIREIPMITDKNGEFDLYFHVGFFPRYKLCIEKPGYQTIEINNKQIDWNQHPKVFNMKRK